MICNTFTMWRRGGGAESVL